MKVLTGEITPKSVAATGAGLVSPRT